MPCDPNDCAMEGRIKTLEEANKNHSRTHEGIFDRLRGLETENAVQNAHYNSIVDKLDDLAAMVKELTGRSGKRWENMADKILGVIIGAVITLAGIGAVYMILSGAGLPK